MKPLDDFAEALRNANVHLQINSDKLDHAAQTEGTGLFHIPLLALCILIVSRKKQGEFSTSDLAAWTGATLSRHFSGIQAARRKLEWSIEHRRRCADALVFLENIELVTVEETPHRAVRCTDRGLDFIRHLLPLQDEVGLLVRGLDRSYRAVEARGLELL